MTTRQAIAPSICKCRFPESVQDVMEHLPVTAAALGDSALDLLGEEPVLAQMPPGYDIWKGASETGTRGVFPQPVSKVLDELEEIFKGLRVNQANYRLIPISNPMNSVFLGNTE